MEMIFTPADFKGFNQCVIPGTMDSLDAIAAIANAKLEAWLKEAPVVYGREFKKQGLAWSQARYYEDTHTARLVDIRELK